MDEFVRLSVGGLELALDEPARGCGLASLRSPGGIEFMRLAGRRPGLWRLEFRTASGAADQASAVLASGDGPVRVERDEDAVHLSWAGLDLPGEPRAVDVAVRIARDGDGSGAVWTMDVRNRSRGFGLWITTFPEFTGFLEAGAFDLVRPSDNVGKRLRQVDEEVKGVYPSMRWPIQAFTVEREGEGLLFAYLDRGAWRKEFTIRPGEALAVSVPAQRMGSPGSGDGQKLSFLIAPARGWLDGAKRYRQVAEGMPWLRKGPIAKRDDFPAKAKRIGVWLQLEGAPDSAGTTALESMRAMGAPAVFHWYNPWPIPYDTYYPNYLPPKPGFAEACARVREAGGALMPHFNGRLWDAQMESFGDEALPNAVLGEDLKPRIEFYEISSKRDVGVMCPATELWRRKLVGIAADLYGKHDADALYVDQVAAAATTLCFGKGHGHEPGNGSFWADGYHRIMGEIRDLGASRPGRAILTSEGTAEPYIDVCDSLLNWRPAGEDDVPFGPAIYSGYATYYGSPCPFHQGLQTVVATCGRAFLWGVKVGWMPARRVADPSFADCAKYLGTLGKLHAALGEFLVEGEYLGEPAFEGLGKYVRSHAGVEIDAFQGNYQEPDFELPPVMGSVWRAGDGRKMALLANLSLDEQAFTWSVENPSSLVSAGMVRRLAGAGPRGGKLPRKESLGPAEIRAYVLE